MRPAMTEISAAGGIDGNVAEYSVGEISQAVKKTLEGTFEHVRVRGEVGRPNYHSSGHLYFTLKDESAAIDAVCWRGTVGRLNLRVEEGMEVVCTGRISSYPRSSRYQIVVEAVELAGEGALLKLLEDRRRKLTQEGLFDEDRKKKLPYLPDVIGVVTSPTGAVIRDILHRLADRFPRHVILWPVPVQGDGAAERIAAAVEGFNRLPEGGDVPRPDVLIVGRGGGSLEDLWAFNEEIVVRAAAASEIPLISAVGHETDTTLIDFAADVRAPTPTAAAEMAVPVRTELFALIIDDERRMISAAGRAISDRRLRIEGLARGLPDPARLLETAYQRLDGESDRLGIAMRGWFDARATRVERLAAALKDPHEQLALAAQRLEHLGRILAQTVATRVERSRLRFDGLSPSARLGNAMRHSLSDGFSRLESAGKLLESLSYERVLERGYAVVRNRDGAPVTRVAEAPPGTNVVIQFFDGGIGATVAPDSGGDGGAKSKPQKRKKPDSDDSQGTLL
jgi:exodeoxyribonuclease VII large subunit